MLEMVKWMIGGAGQHGLQRVMMGGVSWDSWLGSEIVMSSDELRGLWEWRQVSGTDGISTDGCCGGCGSLCHQPCITRADS